MLSTRSPAPTSPYRRAARKSGATVPPMSPLSPGAARRAATEQQRAVTEQHKRGGWRALFSRIEPAMQSSGVRIAFILFYLLATAVVFVYGAAPDWGRYPKRDFVGRIAGSAARGSGAVLNVNSGLVVVLAARRTLTWLRGTALNMFVPFDKAMPAFHSLVGSVLVAASVVHVVGHLVNLGKMDYGDLEWKGFRGLWQLTCTGMTLLLVVAALGLTVIKKIRRQKFELFWYTHIVCFILFYVLIIIHGSHRGNLSSWKYVIVPLLIYGSDRICRWTAENVSRLEIAQSTARIQSPHVLCLRLPRTFKFVAGQYCDIKVPQVSSVEWHPFTIASAPHESEMLFFIKKSGDWTTKLYNRFAHGNSENLFRVGSREAVCQVHIRGPYGAPAQHVGQYEHIVLIGGGVGATPFCSIAKQSHHIILGHTERGVLTEMAQNAGKNDTVSAAFARTLSKKQAADAGRAPVPVMGKTRSGGSAGEWGDWNTDGIPTNTRDRLWKNVSSRTKFRAPLTTPGLSDRMDIPRVMSGSGRDNSLFDRPRLEERSCELDEVGDDLGDPDGPIVSRRSSGTDNARPIFRREALSSEGVCMSREVMLESTSTADGELGNPDETFIGRREVAEPPKIARCRDMVREYSSSRSLFASDYDLEDYDDEERVEGVLGPDQFATVGYRQPRESDEARRTNSGGRRVQIAPHSNEMEIEDQILMRDGALRSVVGEDMMGMSFGSQAMMRHILSAENGQPLSSAVRRASMAAMDEVLDNAAWEDRVLFYLHAVTVNWFLLFTMFFRYSLFGIVALSGHFHFGQTGLAVFEAPALMWVDISLSVLVAIPVWTAVFVELKQNGVVTFISETYGNVCDITMLVPLSASTLFLSIAAVLGFGQDVPHIATLTVTTFWPIISLLLLWRIARTIGSRISLAQHFKSSHSTTKSVDFIWVSGTRDDDEWLVQEMLPLADARIVRLHRYLTRDDPNKVEPWTLDFSVVPLKTTHRRPEWDKVFGGIASRARSGSVIGVFYCGPPAMARSIEQGAMRAMATSCLRAMGGDNEYGGGVRFSLREENFG